MGYNLVVNKMKVSKLTGAALDWAVAQCVGLIKGDDVDVGFILEGDYSPSTDWAQGGPLIENERLDIEPWGLGWSASMNKRFVSFGPTPLIAAMRCYVLFNMNDTVEIPEELKS